MYDRFEILATEAAYSVAILGNLQTGDFELIDLAPVPQDARRSYEARGLVFLGMIGIVCGTPRVALDAPLDADTVSALYETFVRRTEDEVNDRLQPKGDSVAWLEALYRLEAPRD